MRWRCKVVIEDHEEEEMNDDFCWQIGGPSEIVIIKWSGRVEWLMKLLFFNDTNIRLVSMILTYSGNQPSLPLWITSMDQPSFEASTGNWKHSPSPSNSPKLVITQYVLGQNMQSSIWNLFSSYNLVLCHLSSSPLSKSSPFASSRSVIQKPSCNRITSENDRL